MNVKLVSITEPIVEGVNNAEELVAYCARVSNPSNQLNQETAPKLLAYLIKHKHWSPFEMVNVCFEIQTSRAIAAQILRHRSFSFQEFSQRYSSTTELENLQWRSQGKTNRQVGEDSIALLQEYQQMVDNAQKTCVKTYELLIEKGVAKECARMVLPLNTKTTLYMSGTVRSWLSYLNIRLEQATQKEHREIAIQIAQIFTKNFPSITESVDTFNNYTGNFM